MRIGVRVLTSFFLVVGGLKKYCRAKDPAINRAKAENTQGFAVAASNTAFGIGVSNLLLYQRKRVATIGTAMAAINMAFHVKAISFLMVRQLNREWLFWLLTFSLPYGSQYC
jgi:hypothetical protein